MSTLHCIDNAPNGYRDLTNAHTMFAKSYKKQDPTKRGRFNVGEKLVLALCDEARITSTTGTVMFDRDRTRRTTSTKTKAGSEFVGELQLTLIEWETVSKKVQLLIPPITTVYNAKDIPSRKPVKTFEVRLPTEIADESGIMRSKQRKTEVRLYKVLAGETSMLYERGIPVVELETKWHVDVQQKIPLNIERDNVSPAYEKAIYVAVLNEMHEKVADEEASAPWVRTAMEDARISDAAVTKVMDVRFGTERVSYDPSDKGSNKEAVSHGHVVVPGGAMSKAEWKNVKKANAIEAAGKKFPTNLDYSLDKIVPPERYDTHQQKFVRLIEQVSPLLLAHAVTVQIIDDPDEKIYGCSQWLKDGYIFTINIAHQDCSDWKANFHLLIHEAAHHAVQSNDHLCRQFYTTVADLGSMLAQIVLAKPKFFDEIPHLMPTPIVLRPEDDEEAEAAAGAKDC